MIRAVRPALNCKIDSISVGMSAQCFETFTVFLPTHRRKLKGSVRALACGESNLMASAARSIREQILSVSRIEDARQYRKKHCMVRAAREHRSSDGAPAPGCEPLVEMLKRSPLAVGEDDGNTLSVAMEEPTTTADHSAQPLK